MAFPVQTPVPKGRSDITRRPTLAGWRVGAGVQEPYPQNGKRAGTRQHLGWNQDLSSGRRPSRRRPYLVVPPVRGWRAAGCARMGNLGFSLPGRGVRDRPHGEHRSSQVGADLSQRRTDLPIPLSSRTLSTQTACGHHVIRTQPGEVCYVAPAARREQVTTLRGTPRSVVKTTARQGGPSCHVQLEISCREISSFRCLSLTNSQTS